jgi:hypothetical protein
MDKAKSSYIHKLPELIKAAGLDDALTKKKSIDGDFQANWDVVKSWSVDSRYQRHLAEPTRVLLAAIGERNHGVISWVKLYW